MGILNDLEMIERAEKLARLVHKGQVDKAGEDYINHPLRVAARLTDPVDKAIAILHDCIEDAEPNYTQDEIKYEIDKEFHWLIGVAVSDLTRYKGLALTEYYDNIRCSRLAKKVKLADIADNMDEFRLAKLDKKTRARLEKKYNKMLAFLK